MRRSTLLAGLVPAVAVAALVAATAGSPATSEAAAPALDDATIVAVFDLANTADIETGALGARRAQSAEVRDYGTMLSQVHASVRQKGRDLASRLGVTPTSLGDHPMARDHAAAMKRLRSLEGAEFDRAFLRHERDFHAAVIEAVSSTLLPAIQNQELKEFVTSLAPAFESHRVMAERLEQKLAR